MADRLAGDRMAEERDEMYDSDQVLDVQAEASARRHALIFHGDSDLWPGCGVVLVNHTDSTPIG